MHFLSLWLGLSFRSTGGDQMDYASVTESDRGSNPPFTANSAVRSVTTSHLVWSSGDLCCSKFQGQGYRSLSPPTPCNGAPMIWNMSIPLYSCTVSKNYGWIAGNEQNGSVSNRYLWWDHSAISFSYTHQSACAANDVYDFPSPGVVWSSRQWVIWYTNHSGTNVGMQD